MKNKQSNSASRVWFTADTHFTHAGVISRRPFSSIAGHDEFLIQTWNSTVGPHDDVWHLGDFALGIDAAAEARIFRRLKGRKHLIMGNHDENRLKSLPWSSPVHEIKMINVGPQRVVLSHYAMRSWPGIHRGAVNLYGHTHASLEDTTMSCDVGVDAWSFRPISLDECLQRMSMATIVPEEILLARAGKKGLDDDA